MKKNAYAVTAKMTTQHGTTQQVIVYLPQHEYGSINLELTPTKQGLGKIAYDDANDMEIWFFPFSALAEHAKQKTASQ